MEMKIIAYDPFVSQERARNLGAELMPLLDVLRKADFVTLHLPLIPETKNLIGAGNSSL